jgi:hypothetical protein
MPTCGETKICCRYSLGFPSFYFTEFSTDGHLPSSVVFLSVKDLKKKDEFTTDVYIMTNYVYDSSVNRR